MATVSTKTSQSTFLRKLRREAQGAEVPTAPEVREGFAYARLEAAAERLGLAADDLARVLGASERTLQRRRATGRLSSAESDRLWRLEHVWRRAVEAFDGAEDEARVWLTAPKRALSGETPVEHLDTEPGERMVEQLLATIEHTLPA